MTYDEIKEIAKECLDAEIDRKEASDRLKEAKEKLIEAVNSENVDRTFQLQQGTVCIVTENKLKVPDGLVEEIENKVKNPNELSQDLIDEFFTTKLNLNKLGKATMLEGSNPDLESMIIVEPKDKVVVKVGE